MANSNWNAPGAAMSNKSAIKEYGLTQPEIYAAVREGKLQDETEKARKTTRRIAVGI